MADELGVIKSSNLLDEKWYLAEYPDVAALNMDPASHYLSLGAALHRDPGPYFSTSFYVRRYPDVGKAGINPLYHYVVWGENEGREIQSGTSRNITLSSVSKVQSGVDAFLMGRQADGIGLTEMEGSSEIVLPEWHGRRSSLLQPSGALTPFSVEDLEVKLWGGYSTYALERMEQLKHEASTPIPERVNIGWHLTRWYLVERQYHLALENIKLSRYYCARLGARARNSHAMRKIAVAEGQCLAQMGKSGLARRSLRLAMSKLGESPNFWLAYAAVAGRHDTPEQLSLADRDAVLEWINKLYDDRGLVKLRKQRLDEPLSFLNFTAEHIAPKPLIECPEKVSVIIPAYNAEETIHISISSLLEQTWSNLQIVVVDDFSSDGTAAVVQRFADSDPRVQLIRKPVNGGSYPARNLALLHVTGDYVMVHDSDDWSHPQKIEMQVAELHAHPDAVAVMSHWVRFNEELRPVGPWRTTGSYFDLNFSSLMVKRSVVDSLGGWDEVRISGDAEYRSRILKKYGDESIVKVSAKYLLSLSLTREDSLTQTKVTHLRSLDFGLRWLYRDAYQYWQGGSKFTDRPVIDRSEVRPFPAPDILRSRAASERAFDYLFVTDLSYRPYVDELLRIVRPLIKAGCKIALVHWPRYDRYVHMPIQGAVYDACTSPQLCMITNGEVVSSSTTILLHPEIAQYRLDQFPSIRSGEVLIVVRNYPIPPVGDLSSGEAFDRVQASVQDLFGRPGVWIAGNPFIQERLSASQMKGAVAQDLWMPMVPRASVGKRSAAVGVRHDAPPVVGRYCNVVIGATWPRVFRQVKRAYCADSVIRVVLGCDEDVVCSHFGRKPANWDFLNLKAGGVDPFLSKIDFYLYFPNADYQEGFDRALFLAMSLGIPIVMPKHLKDVFGSAAIYSDAERVEEVVMAVWKKPQKYAEAGAASRRFFNDQCSVAKFALRTGKFVASTSGVAAGAVLVP